MELIDTILHYVSKFISFIKRIPWNIKRICIILTKGFDPNDTFDLDLSIAKYIVPRLEYFIKNIEGYPDGMLRKECKSLKKEFNKTGNITGDEYADFWKFILNKMLDSFKYFEKQQHLSFSKYDKKEHEKAMEGLKLFTKYFEALWS